MKKNIGGIPHLSHIFLQALLHTVSTLGDNWLEYSGLRLQSAKLVWSLAKKTVKVLGSYADSVDFCKNSFLLSMTRDPLRQPSVLSGGHQQRGPSVPLCVGWGNPTGPALVPGTQQPQQRNRKPQPRHLCHQPGPELEDYHMHSSAPDPAGKLQHHCKSVSEHKFYLN